MVKRVLLAAGNIEHAGREWAKDEAVRLYSEALELIPQDDHVRRKDVSVQRAVARLMFIHAVINADQLRTRGNRATARDSAG